MQRIAKLVVLSLAAGGVFACNNLDEVVPTTAIPTAGIRFINAVPDTNRMDMRFVDIVENNAQFNVPFRNNPVTSGGVTASTLISYKPAMAGTARHYRIFLSDPVQTVASTVIKDTTVSLTAGSNYTVLVMGNARGIAPAFQHKFFEETVADPGTNVAMRVINATGAAIDVEQYNSNAAPTGTPTTGWANIPALGISAYFNRTPSTSVFNVKINVKPAGGGANIFADTTALLGLKATFSGDTLCVNGAPTATVPACDTQAIGGTKVAGSAITAIIFPRSVAGSNAQNFTTPAASFMWDRRPPRGCAAPYC
jgi:Ca2+-binding RTX toxin-like protein